MKCAHELCSNEGIAIIDGGKFLCQQHWNEKQTRWYHEEVLGKPELVDKALQEVRDSFELAREQGEIV